MYYCKIDKCIHPQWKKNECYTRKGRYCENKVFGCPKCKSTNVRQELTCSCTDGYCKKPEKERTKDEYGYNCCHMQKEFSFIVCQDCRYTEYDD
jgi:hypothetical protein